jgi:septal ring factor EnvC (AmiA/AmiB activator)
MEVTMPSDELSKAVIERIEGDLEKVKRDALERFDYSMKDLRDRTEARLKRLEERMSRDVRTTMFSIGLAVVATAASVMLLGSFTATRDVNNSVIALQKDIIAAQTTIKASSDGLNDSAKKLADAQAELAKVSNASSEARSKLDTTTTQLDKARGEYNELVKAVAAAGLKLDTTMTQLEKARGDYNEIIKVVQTQPPRQ